MIRSMTGYGHSEISGYLIEIHSVNRKALDITSQLPRDFLAFDIDFRRKIKGRVGRGQLTFRISYDSKGQESGLPDAHKLAALKAAYERLADELGYEEEIPFTYLLSRFSEEKSDSSSKEELLKGVGKALDAFIEMREQEGAALEADLRARLEKSKKYLNKLESQTEGSAEDIRLGLLAKAKELKLADPGDERFVKEAFLLAEKADVSEEIARLKSHFEQFEMKLAADELSIGRALDFLIQEMHREINTILSKSSRIEITKIALEIKSEFEKMREQVQNVE